MGFEFGYLLGLVCVCVCLSVQNMPSISGDRVALCAGCGGKISDRYYLLAVDKQWHMRCLKCCECKLNLESELTCFSKDGSIYCKEDYYRCVQHISRSKALYDIKHFVVGKKRNTQRKKTDFFT